jgi:hypothetical protein
VAESRGVGSYRPETCLDQREQLKSPGITIRTKPVEKENSRISARIRVKIMQIRHTSSKKRRKALCRWAKSLFSIMGFIIVSLL